MVKVKYKVVIALTGAGISKSAGIPTFQEFPGITEKLSVTYKKAHPDGFKKIMDMFKENCLGKQPTKAHLKLAEYKIPIITMNVDGLHKAAGSNYVLEIHGSLNEDNVVLYGQQIHYAEESVNLIYQCSKFSRNNDLDGVLLIIGTSMQTQFANYLAAIAEDTGLEVKFINEDADKQVPAYLDSILKDSKYQDLFADEVSFD